MSFADGIGVAVSRLGSEYAFTPLVMGLLPSLAVDFAPDAGNVLRNSTGERHWFGLLGGPYASANL